MQAFESGTVRSTHGWWGATRKFFERVNPRMHGGPRIGLALGGGFARGIAHVGVIRVLEENHIPIHCIGGVSAGALVGAAYASGSTVAEIERAGRSMKFSDVARWTINRLGLAGSDRMIPFLTKLLKVGTFEEMKIPLAVVATDLCSGKPVVFSGSGEVITPIRASCAFPGLFLPLRYKGRYLVDGFVGMEVPALPLRRMGATHVISVGIPNAKESVDPTSVFSVIDRCFQVMSNRLEGEWKRYSNAVIEPDVVEIGWDAFASAEKLIDMGAKAARAALPLIQSWLNRPVPERGQQKPRPGIASSAIPILD